ncbi:MAG TPA: hypothetical protein VK978_01650 [Candidatus Saccharimonadales bacterium]|nr:hypothetical protein [Candidatus Saccharimonadales bacterium]
MSKEQTRTTSDIDPTELARITVMGKTVLDLLFQGVNDTFAEDASIGYEGYVLPGRSHFANKKPITAQDRSNLAAGNILIKLPSQLTLPSSNPYKPGVTLQPPLTQDSKNIWARPTVEVLMSTGFYTTANRPSPTLRTGAPILLEFGYAARFPRIRQQKLTEAHALMPQDQVFQKSFAEMSAKATAFVESRPTVEMEMVDVTDVKEAVQSFDPAEIAPNDITESSWDLADITCGIPSHVKRVSAYRDLTIHNAAAYLGTLLFDTEKLSESLRI